MISGPPLPRPARREILLGGIEALAATALAGCSRVLPPPRTASSAARAPAGPPADTAAFDAHCHIFNGKDIPVAGFLSSWGRGQSSLHGIPVAPDALAAILLAVGTALEVAV